MGFANRHSELEIPELSRNLQEFAYNFRDVNRLTRPNQ